MLKENILSNKIKCKHCGDIIESNHRHDFKWCSCESCAVDGGHDYIRRGFKSRNPKDDFIELSSLAFRYEKI